MHEHGCGSWPPGCNRTREERLEAEVKGLQMDIAFYKSLVNRTRALATAIEAALKDKDVETATELTILLREVIR